jgi:hypothetical protein
MEKRMNPWSIIVIGVVLTALGSILIIYGSNKLIISKENIQKIKFEMRKELEEVISTNPNILLLKKQAFDAIERKDFEKAKNLITTAKRRSQQEFMDHLILCLDTIDKNIEYYKNGDHTAWLSIASQLHIVLCDKNKGLTLVERVIPNISLHPLLSDLSNHAGKYILSTPRMRFNKDGICIDLFDKKKPKIYLEQWLKQTIAILNIGDRGIPITIGGLIQEVWEQAGPGRFDPEVRETLQAASAGKFVEKGVERTSHIKYLVSIAEYVSPENRKQLITVKE